MQCDPQTEFSDKHPAPNHPTKCRLTEQPSNNRAIWAKRTFIGQQKNQKNLIIANSKSILQFETQNVEFLLSVERNQ